LRRYVLSSLFLPPVSCGSLLFPPSFPTRRSSDLQAQHYIEVGVDALGPAHVGVGAGGADGAAQLGAEEPVQQADQHRADQNDHEDRKSTRLNSSHVSISYAVFCLQKKNTTSKTRE